MPDKYYLDIEGAKAIMQKSVDFFDKSKNYILVSKSELDSRYTNDAEYQSGVNSCTFMHKDTKVGELTQENGYTITDPKYTETFKAQNVTGDMFVRFVVDNYRNTGEKMDIVCNYIETMDPRPWEWNAVGGSDYSDTGSKAAIFEGCGPLGETCRFIYISGSGNNVCGVLCQIYWVDVDPLLLTPLTYSSGSYGTDTNFYLYNVASGSGIDRTTQPVANEYMYEDLYRGFLTPYTYIQNFTKSHIQLIVSSSVNAQLTGQEQDASIELYYTRQSEKQIIYMSDNIPTTTGGHVSLTATVNFSNNPEVDNPYDATTLSISSVQVSRSEPITEAELQEMFNPTDVPSTTDVPPTTESK